MGGLNKGMSFLKRVVKVMLYKNGILYLKDSRKDNTLQLNSQVTATRKEKVGHNQSDNFDAFFFFLQKESEEYK